MKTILRRAFFGTLLFFLPLCSESTKTASLRHDDRLETLLKKYNLATPNPLFHYTYQTEIRSGVHESSFELDHNIERLARHQYGYLNNSPFFDVSFILQPEKVRAYQLKNKINTHDVGIIKECTTRDGLPIKATYFNRESDCLVIIGPGFTNEREKMSPFVHLFGQYDVVLFDYRGHGYHESLVQNPSTWHKNPIVKFFGVDPSVSRLGLDEEKDVEAVVRVMRQEKKYTKVIGIGICYSALIFVKTAALYPDLFTHLILDGCWLSLKNFTEKLTLDLKRLCSPQRGGWQNFWLTRQQWGREAIINGSEFLFDLNFKSVSILDFLPSLTDIRILYFHSKDDLVISRHEFEIVWNATKTTEKTAIITSNPHVWNHLKQKELYAFITDLFINVPHKEFAECLFSYEKSLIHEVSQLKSLCKIDENGSICDSI